MSLLVVGSVAFDGIETPYGKHDRMLGGAASYFALAACHFAPVRLVGIVGDDFTAKDVAVFKHQHIDLQGLERATGNSSPRSCPTQKETLRSHPRDPTAQQNPDIPLTSSRVATSAPDERSPQAGRRARANLPTEVDVS